MIEKKQDNGYIKTSKSLKEKEFDFYERF